MFTLIKKKSFNIDIIKEKNQQTNTYIDIEMDYQFNELSG
jgi:hypothetical protein